MATIRENPLHAPPTPAMKPVKASDFGSPAGVAGMRHDADSMTGPLYSHLGHFGQRQNLIAGHNTGMHETMSEFKHGTLHSGSKGGPVVKNRKQAIAIGLNEQSQ